MRTFKLVTLALATLAFVACNNDNNEAPDNGRKAVQITNTQIIGSTDANPAAERSAVDGFGKANTRATDAAWEPGDAIGLVMFQAGTTTPLNGKTALKYTTATATGSFQPTDEANTGYYPEDGAATDILAFYPHATVGADLIVPVNTADQSKLNRIDLMVADKSAGHNNTKPSVSLSFRHKLAKLVITVDKEKSAADIDLTGATLKVSGTATTAKWSLADAKLTAEGAAADVALTATATKDNISTTGIVLPTAAGKGVKLVITTADGKIFDVPLAAGTALAQGTVNTLRVHLSKAGANAEARIEASVADWTTGVSLDLPIIIETAGDGGTVTPGDFVPAQGDQLAIATTNLAANLSSTYTASATRVWTSDAPLNWNNLAAADAPFSFCALVTPKAGTDTPEGLVKDYLVGRTTGIAHGAILNFSAEGSKLTHVMSQVSISIAASTDFTAEQLAAAEVTLASICPLKSIATDGVMTLGEATLLPLTRNADGKYTARIAPQSIAAGLPVVKVKINGTSYSYTAQAEGFAFAAGVNNTLTLTVNKTAITIGSFAIVPWTEAIGNGNLDWE